MQICHTQLVSTSNAIEPLSTYNRVIETLFKTIAESSNEDEKSPTAALICLELIANATIEEEIFLPALRGAVSCDRLYVAYAEHRVARLMIAEIMKAGSHDTFFDAKINVLSEAFNQQVAAKEGPTGLFARARQMDLDLQLLGAQLSRRKEQLVRTFEASGPPLPTWQSIWGAEVSLGAAFE